MTKSEPYTVKINSLKSTWFYSCKSAKEQKDFEAFQRTDISLTTFVVFLLVDSFVVLFLDLRIFQYNPSTLNLASVITGVIFEVLMGFGVLSYLYFIRQILSDSKKDFHVKILGYLENIFVVVAASSRVLTLVAYILNGHCSSTKYSHSNLSNGFYHNNLPYFSGCNTTLEHQIPEGYLALLMIYPTLLSMIVKSVKSETVICSWILTVVSLIGVFYQFDLHNSISVFVTIAFISILQAFEYQRQKISMFFLAQELRGIQTENERLEKENRTNELKHLIGNVAHDLKTPLSSLNMGIDLIKALLEETSNTLFFVLGESKIKIQNQIQGVEEHLQNMRNVNAFMLMNINRCMDYTKATNGLKLMPHIETTALLETLALPLHVMNAMQNGKTHIVLMPVPDDICSHIITDLQWLEENILCLLSNAVKYSNGGAITLSVSKVEHEVIVCSEFSPKPAAPALSRGDSFVGFLSPQLSISSILMGKLKLRTRTESSVHIESDSMIITMLSRESSQHSFSRKSPIYAQRRASLTPTEYLRVEVEDTGIGLSDEVMQSLFSPFKQAQRLAGGTGLGLFSLSRRVDAIGGRYGVMSRRDGKQGSIFWFEIPYKPDGEFTKNMSMLSIAARMEPTTPSNMSRKNAILERQMSNLKASKLIRMNSLLSTTSAVSDHQQQQQLSRQSSVVACDRRLNILLVDDTLSIQKMTRMLLQKQGHTVTVAENGVIAVEIITANYEASQRGGFDVVLMDFQMPVMDGLEATRRIRALETQMRTHNNSNLVISIENSDIKSANFHQLIIGLSANSDDETVQLARSEGMDDFMEKPFKAAIFNEIYDNLLDPSLS